MWISFGKIRKSFFLERQLKFNPHGLEHLLSRLAVSGTAVGLVFVEAKNLDPQVWLGSEKFVGSPSWRNNKHSMKLTYLAWVKCLGFLSYLVYHVWIPDMPYLIWSNRNQRYLFTCKGYLQELTSSSQRTGPRHRARKHSENSSVLIFQFIFRNACSPSYFTWV